MSGAHGGLPTFCLAPFFLAFYCRHDLVRHAASPHARLGQCGCSARSIDNAAAGHELVCYVVGNRSERAACQISGDPWRFWPG